MTARGAAVNDRGRWEIERRPDDPPAVAEVIARLERAVADDRRLPPSPSVLARLIESARRDAGMVGTKTLAALQIRAQQAGLSRDDRLDLATVLLDRDVTSWSDLSLEEVRRVFDALDGFALIAHLHLDRGHRVKYGACPATDCPMRRIET